MRDQPEQQAPPVQRLRIQYAKRGRARFTSSRDFSRAFERALRRAGVPMAYSSGFSPHPRISYANAAPTGAASEAEFCEIGLAEFCDPGRVRDALDAALPPGLDVVRVVPAHPGALADRLTGSRWRVDLADVPVTVAASAVRAFLAAESVEVERMTKNGLRAFDARGAVVALTVAEQAADATRSGLTQLDLTLRHLVPLVRPDDVLTGVGRLSDDFRPGAAPVLTRSEQGLLADDGTIQDALADPALG